ncbi:lipopolysaccharide biosynthesis protein [Litoribacter alkaliphilus]|uniref:Lipopolysaccharide biosynthesis protein n=2 Tax=Litoribacter ruber TaxID=702568 RepID=A0AAP2CM77_9BACT|nr:lipopolysaccharide biosynthesis protein [Litoribacter alkaliphilus]
MSSTSTSLNSKIFSGVIWNVIQMVVNKSFAFVIKLVLARILLPEDFGVVGMAIVFISFIEVLNDVGIGAALIQRREEELRSAHFHTAFWTGVIWSVVIYLIISFIGGPLAAQFYDEPILSNLVPVLSLGVLSSPINLVHKAQLTRSMDFKKIALITNSSVIFSGVLSLILAFTGFGVWALVFNSVTTIIVAMPLYFKSTGWMPKLIWEREAFKDVFGFGIYTTGTKLANNFSNKIDYLIIGKLLSASALGVYTLAFVLTDTLKSQITTVLGNVMYPVYGKKQDDPKSIKKYFLFLIKYNSVVVYPIMVVFIILGEPIITDFFGEKWLDTVIPLKILSVSIIFTMMTNSVSALIRGLGYPSLEFKIQTFKAIFLYVPLIYVGILAYGVEGAAYAVLINKVFFVIISQYFLKKLIGITYFDLFFCLKVPVTAFSITMLFSYLLYDVLYVNYYIIIVFILILYSGLIYILDKDELKNLMKKVKSSKTIK